MLSVISTADNEGICNPESNNVFITFQISLDTALLLLMTTEAAEEAAAMQWPIMWNIVLEDGYLDIRISGNSNIQLPILSTTPRSFLFLCISFLNQCPKRVSCM